MSSRRVDGVVKRFFDETAAPSLLLPDGWFGGRPMENAHQLTFILLRPKRLIVELDDQLLLSFAPRVDVDEIVSDQAKVEGTRALAFGGFQQLVFEHLDYGSDIPHVRSYEEGVTYLIAPR